MNRNATSADSADVGDIPLASSRGRTLLATVVLGSAVTSLTATVVNIALPVLANDLGTEASGQKWVINAYAVALAALIPIGGSLGDRFGRVRVYRLGIVWFAVASVLCALAPTTGTLIGARLLQGVGGALVTPGSLAIIESSLRSEDRGRAVGTWSGMGGIAGAIGPLLGGVLVEWSWRWVFLINIPVAIIVVVLSWRLPESSDPDAADHPIDVAGAALLAVTLGTVSYVLTDGPEIGATASIVAAGGAAVVAGCGLVVVERRAAAPIVPSALFASRTFVVANVLTFTIYGAMGVLFFLLPLELQTGIGWTPIAAGAALLPVTLIMFVVSPIAGDFAARHGPRIPLTVGPLVMAAGMVAMRAVGPGTAPAAVLIPIAIFGLGLSTIVAPVTSTALGAVPPAQAGTASGFNNAVSRVGGLIAVAGVPSLVGLSGRALSDADRLDSGFDRAMIVTAVIMVISGIAAAVLFRGDGATDAMATGHGSSAVCHRCPVDGGISSVPKAA